MSRERSSRLSVSTRTALRAMLSPRGCCGRRGFLPGRRLDRLRPRDAEALRESHPEAFQLLQDVLLLDALGHHAEARRLADPHHCGQLVLRLRAREQLADDRAVDLD